MSAIGVLSITSDGSGPSADRKTLLSETLRRRILTMELSPGSVVDEIALSEEFGLSRPPVRELMRQMASEGYIELEVNRPARVSLMSHDALRAFFQIAPMVYAASTQLAANNASAADVKALKSIQMLYCEALRIGDAASRVHWNDRFHFEIGRIARNAYLMPSLLRVQIDHARLGMIFYRSSAHKMDEDIEKSARQHDEIIASIESGDGQRAGEIARDHMEMARRRMSEYVTPDAIGVFLKR